MPSRPKIHRPHPPTKRKSAAQRGYGTDWQKARLEFLAKPENKFCANCLKQGRQTPATVVDHSGGHNINRSNFWDKSLWRPSCKSCNSRFAASCEGGFGNPATGRAS